MNAYVYVCLKLKFDTSFIGDCRKQPRENWRKEFLVFFSLN